MRKVSLRAVLLLCVLLGMVVIPAYAQEATIVGTVSDPTGAVVPGVAITVTNTNTGQNWTAVSNEAGQYLIGSVRIGSYSVKAEAKGFKTWSTSGVVLQVGDRARVDIGLTVGSASESITVEAEALRVQSDSGEISDVINNTQMSNMMSNGRHFAMLAALVPGASSNMGSFNFPSAGNVDISFNGMNPAHNVWLADGAENYDRGGWGTYFMPSMDAVAEFRTLTSNYGAEYGLASGATMSMVFKSGAKDIHFSMWEFLRNTELQANDWFNNKNNRARPNYRFNTYGFNVGGPITIGSFNKNRDKTFFFYNEEWRKLRQVGTNTYNVAPSAWYGGDLSSLIASSVPANRQITIRVPAATNLSAAELARYSALGLNPGDPFPGNKIDSRLINPNATAFLGTGGMPAMSSINAASGVGTAVFGAASPNNVREDLVRIDHRFNDKFSVFGHYLADTLARVDAPVTWAGGYPTVSDNFGNPSYSFVAHTTHSITPTLLNETGFNMSGNSIGITPAAQAIINKPSGWTVPNIFTANQGNKLMPTINWQGELGTSYNTWNMPWLNMSRLWQIRDDVSVVRGRHELKMGGSYEEYKKVQQAFVSTKGNFTFNGRYTGSAFADFLLGYASGYNEAQLADSGNWLNKSYAFYFQDNYRVNNRLTLNLGVRWEGMPAVYEINQRMSDFYPNLYDPSKRPIFTGTLDKNTMDNTGPGFSTVSGVALSNVPFYMNGIGIDGKGVPRGNVDNHWNNFAPRFGIAYDITGKGKTILRAGFGRMYERVQGNDVYNGAGNTPFSYVPGFSNVFLSSPTIQTSSGTGGSSPVAPSQFTGKVQDGYKSPVTNQWSISVQQELMPRAVLQLAYVGNASYHQSSQRDINAPFLSDTAGRTAVVNGTLNVDRIRPYQGLGQIIMAENSANAHYNSFQTNLRVNAMKGLDLQVAYTYSQAWNQLRNTGSGGDLGTIDNPYDRSYNNGLATWDRPHIFSANYTYQLPFFKNGNKAVKMLLGGWQISGITTFSSGAIVPILTSSNASLGMGNQVTNHPDFSGSVDYQNGAISNGNPIWFNNTGFANPAPLAFGNAKKDLVRGPGRNNWDMSVFKNFNGILKRESSTLQFRCETFNTFNHTQWNGVSANFGSGNFGQVTSTRGPRDMQLGLKLIF